MGACCSTSFLGWPGTQSPGRLRRPRWQSEKPMTSEQLQAKRDEYWDTAPAYGGDKILWDALKAAVEADTTTALLILESAGITHAGDSLHVCYDERGRTYELPDYVLAPPTNLVKATVSEGPQVELMDRSEAGASS